MHLSLHIFQIIRQFEYAKEWLALVNFDNNFMLLMLDQCSSQEEIQELLGIMLLMF